MDEALIKTGTWPNVAIEAGSDPHEVMKRYGVNEHTLRTACYDHEQRIKELERLVRDMLGEHMRNCECGFCERAKSLGIDVDGERHELDADSFIGLLESYEGRGECENVAPDYLDFLCSVCGFVHYHSDENDTGDGNDWAYCPRCGKAVKR